jgi:hypothetical protein
MSHSHIYDEIGAFATIPNEFIDAASDLSDQARWLYVLLRRYTNGKSGKAFPSYTLIQQQTGWTPKTIAKAIRELEDNGWIARQKQFSGPTIYRLIRRQDFPQGSNDSTSRREVSHFPEGSNALPTGKSNKTDNKKTNNKKIEREPARELAPVSSSPDAVSILLEVFPQMPIYSQEIIDAANITNLELWRTICQDWRDNRYSTRNVTGMRDRYRQQLAKLEESHNGQNGNRSTVNRLSANERAARQTLALILGRPFDGSTSGPAQLDSADTTGQQSTALRRR